MIAIDPDKLSKVAKKMNLICGISSPFWDITELRKYYNQAVSAVQCRYFWESYSHEQTCFFWQDVSFLYLLSVASPNCDLLEFCHPAFTRLLEYDQKHNTKWIRTIYFYLYFNGDVNAAANALDLNRNSLYYRLGKIQEIVGPTFDSPNFMTQMKLSANIHIYLEGTSFFTRQEIPPEYRTMSFF